MKRLLPIALMCVLTVATLSGCGLDNFGNVGTRGSGKVERVLLKRPYAFFNRNAGVEIPSQPLHVGQWNHGNGPTAAYDFDVSIQKASWQIQVKTKDNTNLPVTIECSYRMIPGKTVDAALNYMPADMLTDEDGERVRRLSGANRIQVLNVPVEVIFARNVKYDLDEVARDIIDGYTNKNMDRDRLSRLMKGDLVKRLKQHKIPATTLDETGKPVFPDIFVDKKTGEVKWNGPSIAITDVMEIQVVTMRYRNPKVIEDKINEIEILKSEITGLNSDLAGWKYKREKKIKEAMHAREVALNLSEALKKNPRMKKAQRIKKLESIIDKAKKGTNTSIHLVHRDLAGSFRIGSQQK